MWHRLNSWVEMKLGSSMVLEVGGSQGRRKDKSHVLYTFAPRWWKLLKLKFRNAFFKNCLASHPGSVNFWKSANCFRNKTLAKPWSLSSCHGESNEALGRNNLVLFKPSVLVLLQMHISLCWHLGLKMFLHTTYHHVPGFRLYTLPGMNTFWSFVLTIIC